MKNTSHLLIKTLLTFSIITSPTLHAMEDITSTKFNLPSFELNFTSIQNMCQSPGFDKGLLVGLIGGFTASVILFSLFSENKEKIIDDAKFDIINEQFNITDHAINLNLSQKNITTIEIELKKNSESSVKILFLQNTLKDNEQINQLVLNNTNLSDEEKVKYIQNIFLNQN